MHFVAGIVGDVPISNHVLSHESEPLLLQAWQQLDQRHRFGIIPRVCRAWYHLSLPTFTSLELIISSKESVQQLALWLRHHGSTLRHLSLDVGTIQYHRHVPWAELANALQSCSSLAGLHLMSWDAAGLPDLQHLEQLSTLELSGASGPASSTQQFLKGLPTQLKTLDLYQSGLGSSCTESDIHHSLMRLPGLTGLDARYTGLPLRYLASCPNLPRLQELFLDLKWWYRPDMNMPVRIFDPAALAKLPCSFLAVEIWPDGLEESVTWCRSQQGKDCIGKLNGMSWDITDPAGASASHRWPRVLSCLATAAASLKELTLGGCGILDINMLLGFSQLTSLCFRYAGAPDPDMLTSLAALPHLQQLTVSGLSAVQADAVRASAAAAGQLASLTKLELKR